MVVNGLGSHWIINESPLYSNRTSRLIYKIQILTYCGDIICVGSKVSKCELCTLAQRNKVDKVVITSIGHKNQNTFSSDHFHPNGTH